MILSAFWSIFHTESNDWDSCGSSSKGSGGSGILLEHLSRKSIRDSFWSLLQTFPSCFRPPPITHYLLIMISNITRSLNAEIKLTSLVSAFSKRFLDQSNLFVQHKIILTGFSETVSLNSVWKMLSKSVKINILRLVEAEILKILQINT